MRKARLRALKVAGEYRLGRPLRNMTIVDKPVLPATLDSAAPQLDQWMKQVPYIPSEIRRVKKSYIQARRDGHLR